MKTIITLLLLLPIFSYGQKQGNIWYFGGDFSTQSNYGAGVDFNSGSPVALTNSGMTYTEGSAAYCNSAGQLLFYAQGDTVYDKTHNVMLNGSGLGGHWSTAQSALIVPITGDTNKYFIFNNDGLPTSIGTGLHYSLIDMQLNANLGAVSEPKAQNILANTSEHLTGCKHSNGTDFWVITTDYNLTNFYAFQVTPAGAQPAVVSNLGFNNTTIGNIEISPNADKLAVKVKVGNQHQRHLIDFNNTTGVCSNIFPIGNPTGFNTACGFSPSGNIFYDIERDFSNDSIYQYDLSAANIAASKTLIYSRPSKSQFDAKIGPDDKLYFSGNSNAQFLDVINFPDVLGAACGFQQNAVSLAGFNPGQMLPNETLIATITNTNTSVKNKVKNSEVRVYPNPTNSELIIQTKRTSFSSEDKIELFTILGEKLFTAGISETQTTIDLSNYAQGSYMLITNINDQEQSFKVFKN